MFNILDEGILSVGKLLRFQVLHNEVIKTCSALHSSFSVVIKFVFFYHPKICEIVKDIKHLLKTSVPKLY